MIAVSEPDFKNKRRDIDISVLVLLKEVRWAEINLFVNPVGQAFPKGLRNAVYFTFGQSASQDSCIGPTMQKYVWRKRSIRKRFRKATTSYESGWCLRPGEFYCLQEIFLDDPAR